MMKHCKICGIKQVKKGSPCWDKALCWLCYRGQDMYAILERQKPDTQPKITPFDLYMDALVARAITRGEIT